MVSKLKKLKNKVTFVKCFYYLKCFTSTMKQINSGKIAAMLLYVNK